MTKDWTHFLYWGASQLAQMVKNLPAMQKTWVRSLDWEDTLKKEMATHSSILAWVIPRTEEPVGYSPWGCRVGHDWAINTFASFLLYWKADAFIFFNTYLGKQCKPRQHIKKQRYHFADKGPYCQSFSSSHEWMWESDHKDSWALKN